MLPFLSASVFLAINPDTPVAELSVIAFGLIAVTVFPLWGAYFWKGATRWGALLSTVVGVGLNIVFYFVGGKGMILMPQAAFFQFNGFLVAFFAAGLVFFFVSLLTRPGHIEMKSQPIFFHDAL